jgi:UDP-2,3-diacylglucosamine hydrolase
MASTAEPTPDWHLPACTGVSFISDLHLQASCPRTAQRVFDWLAQRAPGPLVILGDWFEAWVGDDVLTSPEAEFERECVNRLRQAAAQSPMAWVCGNRDFLVGAEVQRQVGWTVLTDPATVHTPFGRCVVSHGDAWCVADVDYQAFRQQVRSPEWQAQFVAQPLSQRLALAQGMRAQSQQLQAQRQVHADVDTNLACQALQARQAQHLVHGHTHRPADQALAPGLWRHVLSDWDLEDTTHPRAQVLHWDASGFHREDL